MRVRRSFLVVLASFVSVGSAAALEPWVAPEVARACPRHGPGFIEVPGTNTCVRIGGRVRADYDAGARRRPVRDRVAGERIRGFGTSGRVTVDSRTDTDFGPLRLIYRMDVGEERRAGR